jgi:SAM-dependent methyltransferase
MLTDLVCPGLDLRELDTEIYSVLAPGESARRFDWEAGFYDALVGNPLYLRVMWDNRPADFRRFAAEAIRAGGDGPYLDAGCGSLLFTGALYRKHLRRPAVLVDKSAGMLRQARKKLIGPDGRLPPNITLLQADLLDLPFRPGQFASVMCMGLLHIFADPAALVRSMDTARAPGASLYLSSLVLAGRRVGDRYLAMLERSRQIAAPRTAKATIRAIRNHYSVARTQRGNSLYLRLY